MRRGWIIFWLAGCVAAGAADGPGVGGGLPGDTAELRGVRLAQELVGRRPDEAFRTAGVLRMFDGRGGTTERRLSMEVAPSLEGWESLYRVEPTGDVDGVLLRVKHAEGEGNEYWLGDATVGGGERRLEGRPMMGAFAGSDFWIVDLGLEFLHWPGQRHLRAEMRRSRACHVLESRPSEHVGGYSRVVSWVDVETGGLLRAEAYDPDGALLKEFTVRKIKKVSGKWHVREMEIRNLRAGTRTRLELDLDPAK